MRPPTSRGGRTAGDLARRHSSAGFLVAPAASAASTALERCLQLQRSLGREAGNGSMSLIFGVLCLAPHERDCRWGRRLRTRAYPMAYPQRLRGEVRRSGGGQPTETPRGVHPRRSPASSTLRSSQQAVNLGRQRNASTSRPGREWHSLQTPRATIPPRENPEPRKTFGSHPDHGLGGSGLRYRVPKLPPLKMCSSTSAWSAQGYKAQRCRGFAEGCRCFRHGCPGIRISACQAPQTADSAPFERSRICFRSLSFPFARRMAIERRGLRSFA